MTFVLRDRPDGQIEIIVERPVLVGVFPERETAEKVRAFLQAEADEPLEDPPTLFTTATTVVAEAEADMGDLVADLTSGRLDDTVVSVSPPPNRRRISALPAVVPEEPTPTALIVHSAPATLTEAQIAGAFARLEAGEKLTVVAIDLGVPFARLRGMWAQNRRMLEKHLAEGGQEPCRICKTPFTPSISNPETCARCSHE